MDSLFMSLGPMVRLMGAPAGGEGGNPIMSFLPLIAIVAIFYFLILRPQKRKQKETQNMLSAIKKGDRVVTIGGLYGVIQSVRDTTVIIRADENVKLEFSRSSISSVLVPAASREEKEDKNEEKEKSEGQDSRNGE